MSRWLPLLHVWLPVLCLALAPARAAALDWVVVPYGLSDLSAATRAADRLVRALSERRIAVASPHEARDVFLDRSRAPAPLDPQGAKLLADLRKRALDHAAYGRRDAARRAAEEAMRAAEAAPEALLGDTDAARRSLGRAVEITEAVFGPEHPDVAFVLGTLAEVEAGSGRPAAAVALLERSLAIGAAAYGAGHPDVVARGRRLRELREGGT